MLPLAVFHIKELMLDDGSSPFSDWFLRLDTQAAVKVQVALARMEQGNLSNAKWFKGIGEYKINWGPGIRIYFAKENLNIIVLLAGGHKGSQQADINMAVSLWRNYKR
jgi:putative addiction module killer protein